MLQLTSTDKIYLEITEFLNYLTSKSGVPVIGCGRGLVAGGLHTLLDRVAKRKRNSI